MSDKRKPPETPPESAGTGWIPTAEVEALIAKKECNARYWLDRHNIPSRGERPKLFAEQAILDTLDKLGRGDRKAPEYPPERPPESTGNRRNVPPEGTGMSREPVEAEYRVTPAELQRASGRTGTRYINDFTRLYEPINAALAEQYEARLAERDLAPATKDETIATQREALATQAERVAEQQATIAELRQRAEAIPAEYDRRAGRVSARRWGGRAGADPRPSARQRASWRECDGSLAGSHKRRRGRRRGDSHAHRGRNLRKVEPAVPLATAPPSPPVGWAEYAARGGRWGGARDGRPG